MLEEFENRVEVGQDSEDVEAEEYIESKITDLGEFTIIAPLLYTVAFLSAGISVFASLFGIWGSFIEIFAAGAGMFLIMVIGVFLPEDALFHKFHAYQSMLIILFFEFVAVIISFAGMAGTGAKVFLGTPRFLTMLLVLLQVVKAFLLLLFIVKTSRGQASRFVFVNILAEKLVERHRLFYFLVFLGAMILIGAMYMLLFSTFQFASL